MARNTRSSRPTRDKASLDKNVGRRCVLGFRSSRVCPTHSWEPIFSSSRIFSSLLGLAGVCPWHQAERRYIAFGWRDTFSPKGLMSAQLAETRNQNSIPRAWQGYSMEWLESHFLPR